MVTFLPATEKLIETRRVGEVVVVTPTSDLRELEHKRIAGEAEEVLALIGNDDARSVVLDFRNIEYYGSTALGFFVTLWKRVRERGGRMALCNVSEGERMILEATRLDTVWPICATIDEAMKSVAGGQPEP
jgi:anti-anti-sigma factor